MAITLTYGSYDFVASGPTPQVGIETSYERPNDGPAYVVRRVRVSGYFANYNDFAANQGAVDALRTALKQDNSTLVFHDGTHSIINATARVVSHNVPVEWGQYLANYEIEFEYRALDVTHNISLTSTLGAETLSPPPSFGREYENDGAVMKCKVTITGFFAEGSITANQTKIDALRDLVKAAGTTALVYDGVSVSVRDVIVSSPVSWTSDTVPYTITCTFDTARTGLISAASLGGRSFPITPSFGRRHSKEGHRQHVEVTLTGVLDEGTIALNQAELEAFRDICNTSKATLVYGSFSQSVRNMRIEAPVNWTETYLPYTITADYYTTRSSEVTEACTLCGFAFPQLPSFGRRLSWKRKSDQVDPTYITVSVTLSGRFSGDGVNANIALANSLHTACNAGSGSLVYGSNFSETVRIVSVDTPSDWAEDFLPFTVVCEYDEPIGGSFTDNIIDFETRQQISEVYSRTVFHDIPYVNGRVSQDLGLSHFTITFSGFFVGVTLADALTAYRAEVATRPAGGILMPGPSRTEDADAKRVDYSATYSYNDAATVAAQTSIR